MRSTIFSNLADVRAWERNGKNVGQLDFVALEGKPSLLFAYAALMNPELVEVDGRFYLANGFSKELLASWNTKGIRGAEAQRVINHMHISYLMQQDTDNTEVLSAAADVLANVWRKTLPPTVLVDVVGSNTIEVALTFYQNDESEPIRT